MVTKTRIAFTYLAWGLASILCGTRMSSENASIYRPFRRQNGDKGMIREIREILKM